MVAVSAAAEVVGVAALSSAAVGATAARTRRLTVERRTEWRWEEASTAIVAAVGRGATHVPDAAMGGAGGGVCGLWWWWWWEEVRLGWVMCCGG